MKNKFYKLLCIMLITFMVFSSAIAVNAETSIYISINKSSKMVILSGTTDGGSEDITIQIMRASDGKRVYIDQLKSDETGSFSVSIALAEGGYSLMTVSSGEKIERDFTVSYKSSGGSSGGGSGSASGSTKAPVPIPPEPPRKYFSDLDKFPWAKNEIELLAGQNIVLGTSETTFSPEMYITRGDFTGALIRALGLKAEISDNFIDVSIDNPYAKELGIAKALGIAKGVGNNRMNASGFITRQDMMVLIERALRISGKLDDRKADLSYLDKFADKDQISEYAVDAVALMVEMGFIKGDGQNINPKGNTTRAEAAVVLYRIFTEYCR